MSIVQIPEKFTLHKFVTSHWHVLRLHSRLHPCIHDQGRIWGARGPRSS